MNFTQQQIDALIEGVYDGTITTRDLPVNLYNAISQKLLSALGSVEGSPSRSLLNQLSENIYMFSGAKVYQQINDISLLADDENIKSFANFRDEALAIYEQYNKNWLETEYSTAIGQAQSATRWEQIEDQKKELPYLQYSAVIDPNTSDICLPLDGICLPVEDPFWDVNTPLNHFNCRCTVIQFDKTDATEAGITSKEDADKATAEISEIRQPLFEGNSGKDRLIYNKEHPYFDVPKADREFAKENFGLPIPQLESIFTPAKTIKEAEIFAKSELGVQYANYKGVKIDVANEMNEGLFRTKQKIPNLKVNGIGQAQAVNKEIKDLIASKLQETETFKKYEKFSPTMAKRYVKAYQNQIKPINENTIAHSISYKNKTIDGAFIDFEQFNGVYINKPYGIKSKIELDEMVLRNSSTKWFTKDAKDFSYIMEHEFGHEVDKFLGVKANSEFKAIFAREHAKGIDSVSDRLSRYGATAGRNPMNRPDEMIAEAWAEFTHSKNPRELSREIGELILKLNKQKL
jgi:SPP1 gp7 family putative phage head morphogenesis protein